MYTDLDFKQISGLIQRMVHKAADLVANESESEQSWAPKSERFPVAFVLISLNVIGLTLYVIVCSVILANKSNFSGPFYKLVVALAIGDCSIILLTLSYGCPTIIIGHSNWLHATVIRVFGFCESLSYAFSTSLLLVISINRYIAVVYYDRYSTWCTTKNILMVIMVCALCGISFAILTDFCTCRIVFRYYSWTYFTFKHHYCLNVAFYTSLVFSYGVVLALPIIYVLIFIHIRKMKRNTATSSTRVREKPMVIQFLLICSVFVAYETSFFYVYKVCPLRIARIVVGLLGTIHSSINPVLYLIFNTDIKNKIWPREPPRKHSTVAYRKRSRRNQQMSCKRQIPEASESRPDDQIETINDVTVHQTSSLL